MIQVVVENNRLNPVERLSLRKDCSNEIRRFMFSCFLSSKKAPSRIHMRPLESTAKDTFAFNIALFVSLNWSEMHGLKFLACLIKNRSFQLHIAVLPIATSLIVKTRY